MVSRYLSLFAMLILGVLSGLIYFIVHFLKRRKTSELQLTSIITVFVSSAGIISGIKVMALICENGLGSCVGEGDHICLFLGGVAVTWVSVSESYKKIRG